MLYIVDPFEEEFCLVFRSLLQQFIHKDFSLSSVIQIVGSSISFRQPTHEHRPRRVEMVIIIIPDPLIASLVWAPRNQKNCLSEPWVWSKTLTISCLWKLSQQPLTSNATLQETKVVQHNHPPQPSKELRYPPSS